jgi:hypothetical protein
MFKFQVVTKKQTYRIVERDFALKNRDQINAMCVDILETMALKHNSCLVCAFIYANREGTFRHDALAYAKRVASYKFPECPHKF